MINSTYLANHTADLTGVRLLSTSACQQKAKGYWKTADLLDRVPMLALLYFCGDHQLILQQAYVHNVTLDYNESSWDAAVIAVGGHTRLTIAQGSFIGNNAGVTLAAIQTAHVAVNDNTVIKHNTGLYGAGIAVLDGASLVIRNTTLCCNYAEWGGAVLCAHNASVSIDSSNFSSNVAGQYGGGAEFDCLYTVSHQTMDSLSNAGNKHSAGLPAVCEVI